MTGLLGEWTLAGAARMMRDAVKDRSYVTDTGLGPDVDRFLVYFRMERGKLPGTIVSYEYCLARLAVFFADLCLHDFDNKPATILLRDFLREEYGDVAPQTWNTRIATLKAFFKWALEEDRIDYNPAARIRYRQAPESERKAYGQSLIERIVTAQDERRDRIGVQLLGRMALRRNELRLVQFRHVNHDTRELTVFGKGGTVKRVPIFDDLYAQLLREAVERQAHPDEYLLYSFKTGRVGATFAVIWEDRLAPRSVSGMDKWWARVLKNAGVTVRMTMHEFRHSAGTNFWREKHDLRLTQKLLRHKSIRTTADTYLHDDAADLAEAMGDMPAWDVE